MSPEHGVARAMGSLWRAVQVDSSYYVFWGLLVVLVCALLSGPVLWIGWQLQGIRRALEALARR